jgi:hypothetical protein
MFIKVHDLHNTQLIIPLDSIKYIEACEGCSTIKFHDGEMILIASTIDEVFAELCKIEHYQSVNTDEANWSTVQ